VEISASFLSFRRIPLAALAVCWLLIAGVLFVSRRVPAAHESLITLNPCALPCIFGVTPGATMDDRLTETLTRVPMSYLTYDSTRQTFAFRRDGQNERFDSLLLAVSFASEDDLTVRSAQLFQTSSAPLLGTLSDFLLAGYRPTRVFTDCQNGQQIVITMDDQPLFAQVALGKTFVPGARVMLVGASSDAMAMEQTLFAFGCSIERQWMGFAPLWKYFTTES
jgi:hypothetical protein